MAGWPVRHILRTNKEAPYSVTPYKPKIHGIKKSLKSTDVHRKASQSLPASNFMMSQQAPPYAFRHTWRHLVPESPVELSLRYRKRGSQASIWILLHLQSYELRNIMWSQWRTMYFESPIAIISLSALDWTPDVLSAVPKSNLNIDALRIKKRYCKKGKRKKLTQISI